MYRATHACAHVRRLELRPALRRRLYATEHWERRGSVAEWSLDTLKRRRRFSKGVLLGNASDGTIHRPFAIFVAADRLVSVGPRADGRVEVRVHRGEVARRPPLREARFLLPMNEGSRSPHREVDLDPAGVLFAAARGDTVRLIDLGRVTRRHRSAAEAPRRPLRRDDEVRSIRAPGAISELSFLPNGFLLLVVDAICLVYDLARASDDPFTMQADTPIASWALDPGGTMAIVDEAGKTYFGTLPGYAARLPARSDARDWGCDSFASDLAALRA